MRVPKGLLNHPAVSFVETEDDDHGSDYKYIVHVKEGWYFTQGRGEGCTGSIGVMTVQAFLDTKPEKRN